MKKLLSFLLAILTTIPVACFAQSDSWIGSWASAPEYTGKGDMPKTVLAGNSLRQVIRMSRGGDTIRIKLSNEFGSSPVDISSVYIAVAGDSNEIQDETVKYFNFGSKKNVVIPTGGVIYSDALDYTLPALTKMSITICYGEYTPENATSHRGSRTYSYIANGMVKPNKVFVTKEKLTHWYNIASLEVKSNIKGDAIAILGNSITDGRGSTTDMQNRWTDFLATSLEGNTGVLNLGIGGNCVVSGGISEPAIKRFDRDILGQKGIDRVVIFEGTNDIGCCIGEYEAMSNKIIESYKLLIDKAHAKGLKVYGATITPTKGNNWYSFFHEAMRQSVNEWIRAKGHFDGVIDFDKLVRDDSDKEKLKAEFSEDWLHLNPKGYEAMGKYAAKILKNK